MMDLDVTFDTSELDVSLRNSKDRMNRAMKKGFRNAMYRVKERTKNHINRHFRNQASQMVGNSLQHDIREEGNDVYAIFGSGKDGEGVFTSPDDNEERWNLAIMYNEGTPRKSFKWKGKATIKGRPVYRKNNMRYGWMVSNNGYGYHYGLVGTKFIDHAKDVFKDISERYVKREIEREFHEVI
jgi:hypothetical protein